MLLHDAIKCSEFFVRVFVFGGMHASETVIKDLTPLVFSFLRLNSSYPRRKATLMIRNLYILICHNFFISQNWRKVPKEFHLEYDKLEERPHIPTPGGLIHTPTSSSL